MDLTSLLTYGLSGTNDETVYHALGIRLWSILPRYKVGGLGLSISSKLTDYYLTWGPYPTKWRFNALYTQGIDVELVQ